MSFRAKLSWLKNRLSKETIVFLAVICLLPVIFKLGGIIVKFLPYGTVRNCAIFFFFSIAAFLASRFKLPFKSVFWASYLIVFWMLFLKPGTGHGSFFGDAIMSTILGFLYTSPIVVGYLLDSAFGIGSAIFKKQKPKL